MRFNKYIWELYKDSSNGKKCIEFYVPVNKYPFEKYSVESTPSIIAELTQHGLSKYIKGLKVNWTQIFRDYFNVKEKPSINNARARYQEWITEGISIDKYRIIKPLSYQTWVTDISYFSKLFYSYFPDFFFPYIYDCGFDRFSQICHEFNIPIPEVPKKSDWEQRAFYYIDLCEALYEFRCLNNFIPKELCAFVYGFAKNVLSELTDPEMPNPSKVWFVGGHKGNFEELDNANKDTIIHWQGNVDARRGDIIVMYCLNPRSYIHSIWRANGNGFADPFFNWYSVVAISNPIKLRAVISQKELESNLVWSGNLLVRKNLQGIIGYPIKYDEYLELLLILKSKGQNVDVLPTIKPTSKFETDDLKDERDVEIKLIEPFLQALKYKDMDWIRQMTVKMGRGERNYPDYCFGANPRRGEETAEMILESKFEIKTNKDLQEAYFQTKSYAVRLQANRFIIAAREGIWIFQKRDMGYKFDDFKHYSWLDIENPDILHELKLLIGNK